VKTNPKYRPSLLFDKREAADIDKETILSIGLKAFELLVEEDQKFEEFRPLFVIKDRLLLTKEENAKLDSEIHRFLKMLSPRFLSSLTTHCLEWMIRGYSIHEMNVSSCIEMMIPYHETDEYSKLLDLLVLGEFEYLKKKQIMNLSIQFVNKMNNSSISLGIKNPSLSSFYSSYLIRYFHRNATDNDIRSIFSELVGGLQSSDKDQSATMLMLLTLLSKQIQFQAETLEQLLDALAKGAKFHLELSLMCLISVCKTQAVDFTDQFILEMIQIPKLEQKLTNLCEAYESDEFLMTFLRGLVRLADKDSRVPDLVITLLSGALATGDLLFGIIRHGLSLFNEKSSGLKKIFEYLQRVRLQEVTSCIEEYSEVLLIDKDIEQEAQKEIASFVESTFQR
jgi:U3 small nucleolar RNA-associated protein 10